MRSLFLVIILFAFVCIFFLLQRRQRTNRATTWNRRRTQSLQSMMGGQHQQGTDIALGHRLKIYLRIIGHNLGRILDIKNRRSFVRNLTIPSLISAALILLNVMYIGLPDMAFVPTVSVTVFFVFYAILSKKLQKEFNLNFSEALTTVSGAVSSGRTFLQAMSDYSFTSDTLLGKEFGIIVRRLNLGEDVEQVFMESWKRYPYREYYFFSVAILLNIRGGGRLKDVLAKLQKSISTGIAMEKKMLSMTSEMRMAAKITGAIPFVFLLLMKFISPENFEFILHDDSGKMILYYLLGSELLGLTIIKFLMRGI